MNIKKEFEGIQERAAELESMIHSEAYKLTDCPDCVGKGKIYVDPISPDEDGYWSTCACQSSDEGDYSESEED